MSLKDPSVWTVILFTVVSVLAYLIHRRSKRQQQQILENTEAIITTVTTIATFLEDASLAKELAELNIAAGVAYHDIHGVED